MIKKVKKYTKFRPFVFSRHPSHDPLREQLPLLPFRSVVRLGSTTRHSKDRVECNTIEGVRNSASKLLMKQAFTRANVKTAKWCKGNERFNVTNRGIEFLLGQNDHEEFNGLEYPIIAKSHHGSRGEGNYKLNTKEELESWIRGKNLSNYIFEKFYSFVREYRLHITEEGCFYTCRKVLKNDAPEDNKWQRHDDNCSWLLEDNASFDKPTNWNIIVSECIKALKSLKLDICCFDVKVQSATKQNGSLRENPDFIIIESGSAPSFGNLTLEKYLKEIPKVLIKKHNLNANL